MHFGNFKYFAILLLSVVSFSQTNLSWENKIYQTVDRLVANPSQIEIDKSEKLEDQFNRSNSKKSKKDYIALVILLSNKAYYLNQFNKKEEAITSYENAWKIFESKNLNQYDIVEYCLKPLGNIYTQLGEYDLAENTIKEYYFISEKNQNTTQKISAIINLSNTYQSSGKVDLAINLLEKTLALEKLPTNERSTIYSNLGANYIVKKNAPLSKKYLEKAITICENPRVIHNSYRNLAQIYAQENNFVKANAYFDKVEKFYILSESTNKRDKAKVYYEKALLQYLQGNTSQSLKNLKYVYQTLVPNYNLNNFLPNSKDLYNETILIDAFDLQATIFASSQPKKALECYSLSFELEENIILSNFFENSKIVNSQTSNERIEKCIDLYNSLFQKTRNKIFLEKALQLIEDSKAKVLNQLIHIQMKQTIKEKLIAKEIHLLQTKIINEQLKVQNADIVKINTYIKKQTQLVLQLKSLSKEQTPFRKLNINEVYQKLTTDKCALASYFFGQNKVYLFSIEKDQIKCQILGDSKNINDLIRNYLNYFNDSKAIVNDIENYQNLSFQLFKTLNTTKIVSKKLVIIPDGLLNFVPFESLLTKIVPHNNFSKMPFLVKEKCITYSNSALFYTSNTQFSNNKSLLGVFPIFKNTSHELSFSINEKKYLEENFSGLFLENEKANFENFKKNAHKYGILHLSTHASSGDYFEPASIRFIDKKVFYSDFYSLEINPNLVVLSACETGLGKLYQGEGSLSIARGFQAAGSKNILFTLWKVNDFTTAKYMEHFYSKINSNTFTEANQLAKINYLDDPELSNAKKSPYYWSGFVYYGFIEKEINNLQLVVAMLLTMLILILFLIINRKTRFKRNGFKIYLG